MITGPSVGPGMLLTVLMRWPVLIVVGAVGGGAMFAYKEYDLHDDIVAAIYGKKELTPSARKRISDSDKVKAVDLAPTPRPIVVEHAPDPVVVPVKSSAEYQVVKGDSLSKIAAPLTTSLASRQALMDRMFNDNPQAFKDHDPNQLNIGAVITIPTTK